MKNKIDIRDIRVGNWLSIHHPTMPAENIQISADWIKTIEQINNGLIKEDDPLFRIVEPIPLTGEILEKNGIKKLVIQTSEVTYCCNTPYISCTFLNLLQHWIVTAGPVGSKKHPYTESSGIKYVHQLQNILRDAGIEKDITI